MFLADRKSEHHSCACLLGNAVGRIQIPVCASLPFLARFCELLNIESLFGQRNHIGREMGGIGSGAEGPLFQIYCLVGRGVCWQPPALLVAARGCLGVQEIQKIAGFSPQCSKWNRRRNNPKRNRSQVFIVNFPATEIDVKYFFLVAGRQSVVTSMAAVLVVNIKNC